MRAGANAGPVMSAHPADNLCRRLTQSAQRQCLFRQHEDLERLDAKHARESLNIVSRIALASVEQFANARRIPPELASEVCLFLSLDFRPRLKMPVGQRFLPAIEFVRLSVGYSPSPVATRTRKRRRLAILR